MSLSPDTPLAQFFVYLAGSAPADDEETVTTAAVLSSDASVLSVQLLGDLSRGGSITTTAQVRLQTIKDVRMCSGERRC